eukprot:8527226-Prorocentrum_lima.AAC.1
MQETSEKDLWQYPNMDFWAIWLEYSGHNFKYVTKTVREKPQENAEGPWEEASQAFRPIPPKMI